MKFQITSIATALLVLFFSSTVFAQSSSSILAVADQTKQEEEKTFTTNVNEVLANVHQHISKKLEIDSDLFQYFLSLLSLKMDDKITGINELWITKTWINDLKVTKTDYQFKNY